MTVPPTGQALEPAASALQAAASAEETRFNNLNTRAVALVSATSVVTALAALFARELFASPSAAPSAAATRFPPLAGWLLAIAVLSLAVAVGFLVFGVLLPRKRPFFGSNELTDPSQVLTDPCVVNRIVYCEYREVHQRLRSRNESKAKCLNAAYIFYGAAVAVGALAVIVLAVASAI